MTDYDRRLFIISHPDLEDDGNIGVALVFGVVAGLLLWCAFWFLLAWWWAA